MGAQLPRVVVLGGGFGGLYCAHGLRRAPAQVTVIDRRNFHLFQPLLYQVATASLSPADIASPIRTVLRKQRNTTVWLGAASRVDVQRRVVLLEDGTEVPYDYVVVATGATHAYFGHDEWAERAPGLKTIEDALEMRRRFLLAFEMAERETDPEVRRRLLTFIIVGAGPTGVELAGAMAEITDDVMPRDFRAIDTTKARILLLEGGPRVLPGYPFDLSAKALRHLERLHVEVRTNALVTHVAEGQVRVGSEVIAAENAFWAAGVSASPLGATLGAPLDRAGRVLVEADCSIPGHPEVFVVGDLAHMPWPEGRARDAAPDTPVPTVPGVAQGAIQMGRHAARMILNDLAGQPRSPFRYRDLGSLATIGRAAAVADFGRLRFSGILAWLIWVFVHVAQLIGFRNRIVVLVQWAWAYVLFQRGIRLITGREALAGARERGAAVA